MKDIDSLRREARRLLDGAQEAEIEVIRARRRADRMIELAEKIEQPDRPPAARQPAGRQLRLVKD
jgi:hypothetical protein